MSRWEKFHSTSLRTKVLVPMLAVLVAMLAITTWFVDHRLGQQVFADAREALKKDDEVFRTLQSKRLDNLRLRFRDLAKTPKNRAALQTLDANTILNQIQSILQEQNQLQSTVLNSERIAFILFTPEGSAPGEGHALIQTHSNLPPEIVPQLVAASQPNIARTFRAADISQVAPTDTISEGRQLFNLVSVPVFTPQEVPLGVLTFAEEISHPTAQEIGRLTGRPIAFLANGRLVASTLGESVDESQLEKIFRDLRRNQNQEQLAQPLAGHGNYYCAAGQFPALSKDSNVGYLLFSSCDPPASALELKNLLLLSCLVAIVAGSFIVWYFVKRATQPLLELRDSAEAVGRGDFSRRVAVRTQDECGQLAATFNRMTENVQQAQAELQRTVTTLKTTQAQLVQSEKLSAVGEFVAGVAHELNNPLAAVMGFSELLKDAPVEEKHRRHLDLIFKSATRCKKIVQSLLSFARRHQPERKPVSVNHLVEEVLEIVAYQLRTSNVEVATRFAGDLPMVLADGHQIQQVILNLVNNARQAIEAHQDSGCVTITTEMRDAAVRIIIKDNGPGIPPENLKRIFDPFFTTKEVGKGTGLGLSLCYGLIKEHGGSIQVESKPGDGAAFIIELPATIGTVPATAPVTTHHAENPAEGAGKKVLLVDDEDMLLEMVCDGLKRCGYDVITANSGEAALREIHQHSPDIICTDLKMPGLTGRQLYDWIRTSRPAAARRVVFMTGDIINESLQLFLDQEQLVCLNKPFTLPDLRQTMKKILSEHSSN